MKNKNLLLIITAAIVVLSALVSSAGIYRGPENETKSITSVWGEVVDLDGQGLYARDSISIASQGRAQDAVTLIFGIPLLIISFILYYRGKLIGSLLYAGTMAYFLYTYISYCFIVIFNSMFLLYTALFSLSLLGFILIMSQLNIVEMAAIMAPRFHRKSISVYLFIVGLLIFLMWMTRIIPAILNNRAPFGIEHYTSLGIQVLDLSIIVPLSIITSILLWRKKPWGFVLSGIIILKALTLLLAIFAMIIAEYIHGNPMNPIETVIFLSIIIANLGFTILIFKAAGN